MLHLDPVQQYLVETFGYLNPARGVTMALRRSFDRIERGSCVRLPPLPVKWRRRYAHYAFGRHTTTIAYETAHAILMLNRDDATGRTSTMHVHHGVHTSGPVLYCSIDPPPKVVALGGQFVIHASCRHRRTPGPIPIPSRTSSSCCGDGESCALPSYLQAAPRRLGATCSLVRVR